MSNYRCSCVKDAQKAYIKSRRMSAMKVGDLNSSHRGRRVALDHKGTHIEGVMTDVYLIGERGGAYYDDSGPDADDTATGKVVEIGEDLWRSPLLPLDLEVRILD